MSDVDSDTVDGANDDLLTEAKEAFDLAVDAEDENRRDFLDDLRFARLEEQWPEKVKQDRQRNGRPCLTINKLPSFIRQVVNDARQNKPSIKVHPVDSQADPETAEIYNGLIRNIEYTSSADVAYDTATESAVTGGFGYLTVDIDYAFDDSFDLDILIKRVADPLTIYGDPVSMAADSSDWMTAFEIVAMPVKQFEKDFPDAECTDWDDLSETIGAPWFEDNTVLLAKYWKREEIEKQIVLLSDGSVYDAEKMEEAKDYLQAQGLTVVASRPTRSYKVTRHLMTGAEILKSEDWPGRYIPIIPVYGDEVVVEGQRYFRSLIRDAKDAQRMHNYWRTTSTELVALAPRAPWVGKRGTFEVDAAKWATANTENHATLEYDGDMPPQRQPFAGVPAGAIQEALNANDDMKAIMGLFNASLGMASNETSGKAIMARQREGDVSTFHFTDNMTRAIRHTGRVIIDLIPHVYSGRRIVRVLGEDGTPSQAPLNQPVPVNDQNGQPVMVPHPQIPGMQIPLTRVYDLSAGKYDLTVTAGPSFTTRREEAATQMTQLMQAFPQAAPIIGDIYARNLDWPGADEIADRLQALYQRTAAPQQAPGLPPQIAAMGQQMQQRIAELEQENAMLKQEAGLKAGKLQVEAGKMQVDAYGAQTDRMRAATEAKAALPNIHVVVPMGKGP